MFLISRNIILLSRFRRNQVFQFSQFIIACWITWRSLISPGPSKNIHSLSEDSHRTDFHLLYLHCFLPSDVSQKLKTFICLLFTNVGQIKWKQYNNQICFEKKKIIVTKEAMPRILFHVLGCMTERILKVHHTSTISNSCENGRDLGGFFLFLQQSDSLQ